MKIMIIAASELPIPAYKGGATETLISELLSMREVKENREISIDVFSHCDGNEIKEGNVKYHFYKKGFFEKVYVLFMRIIRILLGKRIYIPDIFPIILAKIKKVNFADFDLVILEGCMQQVCTTRLVYRGTLALHIHTVMTLTPRTPGAKKVFSECDYIISNSEYASGVLKSINPSQNKKVLMWKNCIEIRKFEENVVEFRDAFRRKHNIGKGDFLYIFCGRVEPGKGVLELVKAFKKAQVKGKLLIVGASWFSTNRKTKYILEVENEARSVEDRIIFTGYVSHEEIPLYYHASDVAIMPSIYMESAGLVAIEAQASGIPVLISNVGGIPEFVHKNSELKVNLDTHFIENLASMMKRIQNNNDFYIKEQELAKENVKTLGMDRYCGDFYKILSLVKAL